MAGWILLAVIAVLAVCALVYARREARFLRTLSDRKIEDYVPEIGDRILYREKRSPRFRGTAEVIGFRRGGLVTLHTGAYGHAKFSVAPSRVFGKV